MLAAEKIDAVVMAVPPVATCESALLIIARGVPLLLEKPPGLTMAELNRLIASAEAHRAIVQVGFNRRMMPVMERAMEILESEFPVKSVAHIEYEMIRSNRWNEDFSTTAIHSLDALRFLARAPYQMAELRYHHHQDGDRAATSVRLDAETTQGTRLGLTIQPVAGRNAESIRIHGVGRSLSINLPASPLSEDEGTIELWAGGKLSEKFSDHGQEMVERMGIVGELATFVHAVRIGAPVTPTLVACSQQVALMEAIRSRRTGSIHFDSN
jgi:predicted dehydrogenase